MVRCNVLTRIFAAALPLVAAHVLYAGENVLEVEEVLTAPGTIFPVRVYLTHDQPLQGYEVSLLYDSTVLTLKRITMQGTDAQSLLGPIEFFAPLVVPDYQPSLGLGHAGVIFDWQP